MAKISDSEILELFHNPQTKEKGFNLLVKKFQEPVYWHLRRIVIDHEDTNDVMQNVFLKIWQYLGNFREDSKLYTWIYRIATNEAISFLKTSKAKYNISLNSENENYLTSSLHDDNFFKPSEIEMKLQKSIMKLPNKQRLVFLLRYYENMNYNQMSEVLKTNINTLKATYHIAAKKIEDFLKEN
jgi:RNA polymerase sigma factor (sigma-70 family)